MIVTSLPLVGGVASRIAKIKSNNKQVSAGAFLTAQVLDLVQQIVLQYVPLGIREIGRDNDDMVDALPYLFDYDMPLHAMHFDAPEQAADLNAQSARSSFEPEELAWREGLQIDSKVDCIKKDHGEEVYAWHRGRVVNVIEDRIKVHFEDDFDDTSRELSRFSNDLAAPGQQTQDLQWRYELKENDLVDAFDTTHVWYSATIIRTDT